MQIEFNLLERFSLPTYGGRLDPIHGLCCHQMPRQAPDTEQDYKNSSCSCSLNLMVDRVPRNTVDCPTVTTENSNGFVPPHMEDVHLQSHPSPIKYYQANFAG